MNSSAFDPRLRPVLLLAAALSIAACTDSAPPPPPPAQVSAAAAGTAPAVSMRPTRNQGVVRTALTAGGYSYIEVDIDGARYWLATMASAVQPGMNIAWQQFAVMQRFSSKALGREFEQILFVDRVFIDEAAAAAQRRGIVAESIDAAGYSFIRVDEKGTSIWLAAPETPVDAGQSIEWSGGSLMRNFSSRSLDRVFDEIIFVGAITVS